MRVQANGKVRRSPGEWQQIFERFRTSGLSESAFCRREKISKSSFSKWKRRVAVKASATSTFVEWTAPIESTQSDLRSGELEITLPGGVSLRWKP